jgi:hypothetical protein
MLILDPEPKSDFYFEEHSYPKVVNSAGFQILPIIALVSAASSLALSFRFRDNLASRACSYYPGNFQIHRDMAL